MLILQRKPNQRIVIDNRIVITVCESSNRGAKIGIEAPRDVSVVRGELIDRETSSAERPACCDHL